MNLQFGMLSNLFQVKIRGHWEEIIQKIFHNNNEGFPNQYIPKPEPLSDINLKYRWSCTGKTKVTRKPITITISRGRFDNFSNIKTPMLELLLCYKRSCIEILNKQSMLTSSLKMAAPTKMPRLTPTITTTWCVANSSRAVCRLPVIPTNRLPSLRREARSVSSPGLTLRSVR